MRRCKELIVVALVLTCLVAVVFSAGRKAYTPGAAAEGVGQGTVLLSSQIPWNTLNTSVSAGEDPNALIVTERTYLTLIAAVVAAAEDDEKISYAHIPPSWNGVRFRCRGYSDAGDADYQIYVGTLGNGTDCELSDLGELAFVVGTQASITTGLEMADELVVTAGGGWEKAWATASPANNEVATASIDLMGADFIVAVPTTIDANSVLIIKGY